MIGVLRQNDLMEDGDTPEEGEEATDGTPDAGSDEPELFRLGLDAIPALITEITQAGMEIRYRCALGDTGDGGDVSPRTATTIYRIVQEGLTNARKHSPGAVVDVTITPAPGETVTVEVINVLPRRAPLHPVPGSGLGLVGLGERVQLIGGRLTHERTPDDRFVLRAVLPPPPVSTAPRQRITRRTVPRNVYLDGKRAGDPRPPNRNQCFDALGG